MARSVTGIGVSRHAINRHDQTKERFVRVLAPNAQHYAQSTETPPGIISGIASLHCESRAVFEGAFRRLSYNLPPSAALHCTSSSTQSRLSGNQKASGRGGAASLTESDGLNILDHADR